MGQMECVRKLWFCSGHRIVGHENKCANAHGHNYTLYVHARSKDLDNIGRVIDFSVIKEKVNAWIEANWDHTFIIYENDELLMPLADKLTLNKDPFIASFNPTAENMAHYLLKEICPKLFENDNIVVNKIELWESENNKVIASLGH